MRSRRNYLALIPLVTLALAAAAPPAHAAAADQSADTIDEDVHQTAALGLYYERCDVEPGSARERYAKSDWEQLVASGSDPARLLEIAEAIPADCSYISFKSAILATERELLRPPPPAEPGEGIDAQPQPKRWKPKQPRTQTLRRYRARCGPLTEAESLKAEADYQKLLDLRFPAFDADDIRDNAGRLPGACAGESLRDGILRVEMDRFRLRRNIGFIGGGVLAGLSVFPLVHSLVVDPCEGGLECLGPNLSGFGAFVLGITGIVTGTILILVGAAEQHNVERVKRLLGEGPKPDLPGQIQWTGNGVNIRF